MPSALLTLALTLEDPGRSLPPTDVTVRAVRLSDSAELARLYLEGYPPGVAASDLAEATAEIAATVAGDFGVLRRDATLIAELGGVAVGAILVTERSIWDDGLDGPFVIDFFVVPAARDRGVGSALLARAVEVCRDGGCDRLSLRVGDGTSESAHRLYARFGFRPAGRNGPPP